MVIAGDEYVTVGVLDGETIENILVYDKQKHYQSATKLWKKHLFEKSIEN